MSVLLRRLHGRIRDERGYSLVELLTVMLILGVVLGALTQLFVAGTTAEMELNRRFQAQQNARLALDKLRRDGHCASVATVSGTTLSMTLPAGCPSGSGTISWCTAAVTTSPPRYRLYRRAVAGCSAATGVLQADYLTLPNIFTFVPQSADPPSLAKLGVAIPVNLGTEDPQDPTQTYELRDDIVLRNSQRA